eukprot:548216-Prorocentrum_lima.AAC.1
MARAVCSALSRALSRYMSDRACCASLPSPKARRSPSRLTSYRNALWKGWTSRSSVCEKLGCNSPCRTT